MGIAILVKLTQLSIAKSPILITVSGIIISVKLVQSWNVCPSICVTPFGISILGRLLHPSNADLPILVTLLGIFMSVNLWQ